MFEMSDKESDRFYLWYSGHDCEFTEKDDCSITFAFSPRKYACKVVVHCKCGEEIDITE